MLQDQPLLAPDRIGTDGAGPYPSAIAESCEADLLLRAPTHYVTKHLRQGIESDHFRVKRPMPRVGGFRSFNTARRTICGFEAMLWLHKGFGFAGAWPARSCRGGRLSCVMHDRECWPAPSMGCRRLLQPGLTGHLFGRCPG